MVRDLYPDIAAQLTSAGWSKATGGTGSHEKWRDEEGRTVIVPRTTSRHTANAVMKQAGLPKAF